jgi:hypothetical protein
VWTALSGAKTVIDVAKGMVDTVKGVFDVRRAEEEAFSGSPEERAARTAVAGLYFEILYNLEVINQAQKVDPARLLVSQRVWERSDRILEHLSQVLQPVEVGVVVSPFVQLDNYERVFSMPWVYLLAIRLKGTDHVLLENLALAFRGAEELLRPKVLSKAQRERLERFLTENRVLEPSPERAFPRRLLGVVGSMPIGGLAATGLAVQLLIPDSWLWRRLRIVRKGW